MKDKQMMERAKEIVHIKRLGCVDPIEDLIASALQQVRKEAILESAEVAKRFNYWNNLTGKDAQELTAFRIADYIRQLLEVEGEK